MQLKHLGLGAVVAFVACESAPLAREDAIANIMAWPADPRDLANAAELLRVAPVPETRSSSTD
jgi:hypothetical protein